MLPFSSAHLWCRNKSSSLLCTEEETQRLLNEQLRSLNEKSAELEKMFPSLILDFERALIEEAAQDPPSDKVKETSSSTSLRSPKSKAPTRPKKPAPKPPLDFLISAIPAQIMVILLHTKELCQQWLDCMDYIEDMLRKQLIAAIGKEVTSKDFGEYMVYHNRKLFREQYRPRAFSHAIRVPGRNPEGILEIVAEPVDGTISEPIQTMFRRSIASSPMKIALNASTKVQFYGTLSSSLISDGQLDFPLMLT